MSMTFAITVFTQSWHSPQGKFTLWDLFDILFSTLCWEEGIANKV
jgi:hypothetical protein